MIVFPNAKINIGLNIISKRADGFHNLESVFYPVPWTDVLEIIPAEKTEITFSGFEIDGGGENNLCFRVYAALKTIYQLPPVKIHLHKNIPVGAGLGGGSSDAAFTLMLLNDLFDLRLSKEEMQSFIKDFGSDCAFFIHNKPLFAYEKGDTFRACNVSLKGKYIVLIYPDLFISTKEAYAGVKPGKNQELTLQVQKAPGEWKGSIHNDFEDGVFKSYPVLESIKAVLYDKGATYAAMSGSGSTIYGLFEKEIRLDQNLPDIYNIWQGYLEA